MKRWPQISKTAYAGIFFIALIVLYFLVPQIARLLIPKLYIEMIRHLLLILSAMMGVHLLERAYLQEETKKVIMNSLKSAINPSMKLLDQADNCGLSMVYTDRKAVQEEIFKIVANAKERLWILGIAFSEEINLQKLLQITKEKNTDAFDLRILLLDVLRSPAVFRAFLENSPEIVKKIVEHQRTENEENTLEPYLHQRMYQDFSRAYSLLENQYSAYKNNIRFYGLNPNCWMIIADDIAYFEPYTLGRGNVSFDNRQCIGALMPVLKFINNGVSNTFGVLEDHFRKMWLTSNQDLFHIGSRIYDCNRIIFNIFNQRKIWFKHVYGALYKNNDKGKFGILDKRKYPRLCEINEQTLVDINNNGTQHISCEILNYSYNGVCLKLSGVNIKESIQSIRFCDTNFPSFAKSTRYALQKITAVCENRFQIKWSNSLGSDQIMVGIEATITGSRN